MPDSRPTELFRFASSALPPDTFHVTHFRGAEGLNTLFSFTIDLVSTNASVDPAKVLSAPARFIIHRDNGENAVFQGYPARMEQGGMFNGYAYYSVELRPAFWKLTQAVQSAIFLSKTVQETADEMLNGQQFFNIPHEFRFTRSDYPSPEFAMQYGESVYDYILWRMEEQGAYFFFAPDGDKVIFADSPQSHDAAVATVHYSPASGLEGDRREEVLTAFTLTQTPLPLRVVVRSFDWKKPGTPVVGEATVSAAGMGDVYLTNENVESNAEASRIAKIRAEELVCRSRVFTGAGSVPVLRPGVVFTLQDHYNQAFNRDYMVTEITHEGAQETFLSMGLGIPLREAREHLFYRNHFSCIESDAPYRPARTAPRASIPGVIRAFVDGAGSGARAELDEYGRYKLLFPFDISGRKGGNASCWIRMAQPQVGKDSGMSFPLLPGAEVTVTFLDGNPDRPVITGALPNGETGAITGQGNANFCGIRTPGGNQITINDTDTHQGISLQTPSGLGLTMTAGSLGSTTHINDYSMGVSTVSNEIANMGKTLVTGCRNVSAVSQSCYAWMTAIGSAVQNSISNVLDSLAAEAAKKKEQSKANRLQWGSDAVKTAGLAFVNLVSTIKAWNLPTNEYGISLQASKQAAMKTMQVWPGMGKMIAMIVAWIAGRAIQDIDEAVDSGVEAAKAEKKAQDQFDADLVAAGGKTTSDRKKDYETTANDLVKKIAEAMTQGDAETAQKLQAKLKALQDDYAALFDDTSSSYYKYARQDTVRRAMVSAAQDMLPEITALALQFKLLGGQSLEHGGISLDSPDKNINLHAQAETISLHSGKGIFLNTNIPPEANDDKTASWGVKSTEDYAVGSQKANALTPFVAVNTTNHYVEATKNREKYDDSERSVNSEKTQHTEGKDYIEVSKDKVLLHAENVTMEYDDNTGVSINNNGITLFAYAGDNIASISIDKSHGALGMMNAGAIIGVEKDGKIMLESKEGAKVVANKSIALTPISGESVVLDKICITGSNIKATTGMLELGGEVKIMGDPEKPPIELYATVTDLDTAMKNQQADIQAAKAAADSAKADAKAAANAKAAADKAAQEAKEVLASAKDLAEI